MTNDDDIPGIRLWGDSRLEKGQTVVHPENDAKPSVGDNAIDLSILRSTPASRASARNEPQKTRLVVDLMTDDAAVLSDVAVNVATPGGTVNLRTDFGGRIELDVDDGTYDVSFPETPLAMPQPALGAVRPGGGGLLVERTRTEPVHVSARTPAKPTNVVVRRPQVLEIVVDGYAEGSSVMRWGGTRWRTTEARPDAVVLGTMRAALRVALTSGRGHSVVCVGHADPKGSDVANADLGLERARSIALFLRGDKDGWAAHAAAHATELDEQCALVEVSRILGNAVALDDDDGLARVHEDLLHWAGLDEPVAATDEWRAIAELYDIDMASFMRIDVADLEAMRAQVQWCEPASCGEDYPRPEDEFAPIAGPAVVQRRVGILVMTEADAPARLVDVPKEAYDGTYKRTTIETPTEVLFTLALVDERGKPLPGARAWLSNDVGISPVVADAGGLVIFPCARGEVVRVVNASDASKSGHVVAGGLSSTTTSEGA
jgi:hypothetical protein